MLGVIYLAIGALVGVAVNGAVIILSIWMLDVVVGPAAGGVGKVFTCWLPTHCHSLWMVDMPSHHAGRPADVGIALGGWRARSLWQGRSWRPARAPHGNVRKHPASCRVRCGGQAVGWVCRRQPTGGGQADRCDYGTSVEQARRGVLESLRGPGA